MSGNNPGGTAWATASDRACFDSLPPQVKRAFHDAAFDFLCGKLILAMGLRVIEANPAKAEDYIAKLLDEQMRDECLKTYGAGHPQARQVASPER